MREVVGGQFDGSKGQEHRKRQRRSIAEKRRIVELAMQPGAWVACVAREHGVNANMVHYWRNLYRQGRLGEKLTDSTRLLPVRVKRRAGSPGVESVTKLSPTPALLPARAPQAVSTSSLPRSISALKAGLMPRWCAWFWNHCQDDHAAGGTTSGLRRG